MEKKSHAWGSYDLLPFCFRVASPHLAYSLDPQHATTVQKCTHSWLQLDFWTHNLPRFGNWAIIGVISKSSPQSTAKFSTKYNEIAEDIQEADLSTNEVRLTILHCWNTASEYLKLAQVTYHNQITTVSLCFRLSCCLMHDARVGFVMIRAIWCWARYFGKRLCHVSKLAAA